MKKTCFQTLGKMQQGTVALEKRESKPYNYSGFLLEGNFRTLLKQKKNKADPDDFIELKKEYLGTLPEKRNNTEK